MSLEAARRSTPLVGAGGPKPPVSGTASAPTPPISRTSDGREGFGGSAGAAAGAGRPTRPPHGFSEAVTRTLAPSAAAGRAWVNATAQLSVSAGRGVLGRGDAHGIGGGGGGHCGSRLSHGVAPTSARRAAVGGRAGARGQREARAAPCEESCKIGVHLLAVPRREIMCTDRYDGAKAGSGRPKTNLQCTRVLERT